jgi:dephospho-CoA kinase
MIKLGITGSIATGKSTISKIFKRLKIDVFNADDIVHKLLNTNTLIYNVIKRNWPEACNQNFIDRNILGKIVYSSPEKLKNLEELIHPFIQLEKERFVKLSKKQRKKMIVFDIPLLYETGSQKDYDYVIVTTCRRFIQNERFLKRKNSSLEKLKAINLRQFSDWEKRKYANLVINTGAGKRNCLNKILKFIKKINDYA